jgi:hypothetical protein
MGSIGIIIKNGLTLSRRIPTPRKDPYKTQEKLLIRHLRKAQFTVFGQEYNFTRILKSADKVEAFQESVPVHTYESILKWWQMSLQGESSVCWPGKVDYFALSSGTSTGASKYIPVTRNMIRAIQRSSVKQILSLAHCNLPESFYEKDILMLGSSTNLDYNGIYYAGDLSGITSKDLPFWFQPFYKPGREIARTKNWQDKLDLITKEAHKWDVGAIVGVPAWFQLLMERIIELHKVKTIHDIWPNLMVFTHGGVALEPYKKGFESLLGKPLIYLETYLASEGFIAYQARPESEGMKLLLRGGIFFEFIPFTDQNFDGEGNVLPNPKVLTVNEVEEGPEYVLLLSTCSGAWRYIIGDVIKFTNAEQCEIKITGRTKHYLSLCGEHLSVDNMNRAIELVSQEFNINIREFTVAGVNLDSLFGHHWFISIDDHGIDKEILKDRLDFYLKQTNDDYITERKHALKDIMVDYIPNEYFHGWLKSKGREGAQIKFPRVLKNEQYQSWKEYLLKNAGIEIKN